MSLDRRQFLAAGSTLALAGRYRSASAEARGAGGVLPASLRDDFPSVGDSLRFDAAGQHPLGRFAADAVERQLAYRLRGPGDHRADFSGERLTQLKQRYARLINAEPIEIAFTASTTDGENIVVTGMDLVRRGGNVVIDELCFTSSIYLYKSLEAKGVELRIVKHRDWAIDVADVERAVDRHTRLVSIALVSHVNGFMHDAAAVSAIAHARGAYVFADIVQAVGAVPVDVRALDIDFASAGTYKWLMGERGLGFLYVKKDLQDAVVPTTRYGHRQITGFKRRDLTWEPLPGAAKYETGGIGAIVPAAVDAGLRYIEAVGVPRIRAHAQQLTDRLQQELPALGYPSLTPPGTATPIVAFALEDTAATVALLQSNRVGTTVIAEEDRLRLSVSVFNSHRDIDRLVDLLARKTVRRR